MSMQYFIKCSHCNFLNPFKTEFVTFCDNCGKKLPYNFQDWRKNNPTKTLNDFRNEVCVSVSSANHDSIPVRQTSYRSFLIAFLFLLLIAVTGLYFSGYNFQELFLPAKTPDALLKTSWERTMYGKYGLSVVSPGEFHVTKVEFPDEYKSYIEDAQSFSYQPSKKFKVILTSVFYKEGVQLNIEGAVSGFAGGLMKSEGISNVEFKKSPVINNDVKGIYMEGTYHDTGKFMHFVCLFYVRNSNMWQVLASYPDEDQNAGQVAEKIINSVEINYDVKSI